MGQTFSRDKFTWLMYFVIGYYAYLLNGIGPIMPFLRAEMNLSYTVSSLHLSAFAVGMLVAGTTADRISKRFGRRRAFWFGALGMALGVGLLLVGRHSALTISGTFLMGAIGTLLLIMVPAALSDRHGSLRAVAITEANVAASLCGVLAPVLTGFLVRVDLGWRSAFIVPVLVILILAARFHQFPFPQSQSVSSQNQTFTTKLPRLYWAYWIIILLVVSIEFCLIFWAATFLETERNFARADAAFALSLFLGAMLLGRMVGSRLARWVRSEGLIAGSLGVCSLGFLIHWLSPLAVLTLIGLFIAGLGVANLYPQTLTLAVGTVPDNTDEASARASLASGMAILTLPLLLGGIADYINLRYAYGLVILLIMLAAFGTMLVSRYTFRTEAAFATKALGELPRSD